MGHPATCFHDAEARLRAARVLRRKAYPGQPKDAHATKPIDASIFTGDEREFIALCTSIRRDTSSLAGRR